MEKLQITSEGIKKNLNKIKPHIAINDNGNGINYNEIKKKISPFNESEKGIGVSFKSKHSLPRIIYLWVI